jgi:hypothetical protein
VNVVTLHILQAEPSADFGLLRIAAPALEPGARVVLWEGLPPEPAPDSACLAPVVLQGDLDGHRAYAERIPAGARLHELPRVPDPLRPVVAVGLLEAVLDLHARRRVHGTICKERVVLGDQGEVVLIGRGRAGGSPEHDASALRRVLAELGIETAGALSDLIEDHRELLPRDAHAALGAWVRSHRPAPTTLLDQVLLHVGPTPDSLDEVVPDLGPDAAEEPGLLDRWAVRTGNGDDEHTAELTDGAASAVGGPPPLALSLWTRLAAPPEHRAPGDRFRNVEGEPSRGLRALLLEEAPDSLPALVGGDVGAFVLDYVETHEDGSHADFDLSDPEITDDLADSDGDTAVYDTRELSLRNAIRRADSRSTRTQLEARMADAERRAHQAEHRAATAEGEVQTLRSGTPGAASGIILRWDIVVLVAVLAGTLLMLVWLFR